MTESTTRVVVPHRSLWIDSIKKTAFIIGSALLVVTAARNTITWHAQRVWGASGDFWQRRFNSVCEFFGDNDFAVYVFGTFILFNFVFWALNAVLIFIDLTAWPKFLLKYKIQPDKNVPVDRKKLLRAVSLVLFNTTVVGFPFLLATYYVMRHRGCVFSGDLPTFQWILLEISVCILVEEIMFYYSHRLFHYGFLYRWIHKRHHEWTAPIGVIALYAHPIEHLISNMLPPVMGPIIMGSHVATAWMWFSLALMSTINSHSGYHFPFFPSPEAHDFHHLKFVNNFGVMGVLDRLHGTDNLFRSTKAYERHLMMLTMVPPRESIPDDVKAKPGQSDSRKLSDSE